MKKRHVVRILAATGAAAFVACTAPEITGPGGERGQLPSSSLLGFGSASLVECPTNETATASGLIGLGGGIISAGGVSIAVPANALLADALVTVTVPASRYMEVDISVQGAEHFQFEVPVVVTMSYARCARGNIDLQSLSAWYIDSETKELLQQMPSVDNKLLRTVTFTTDHLSGYAIAN